MRSLYDNVTVGSFAAAFNTTGATICTGASLDTRGYNSGVLRVFVSTMAAGIATGAGGSLTAVLQESTDGTTWTTATDNGGTTIGGTIESTTTAVLGAYRIEGLGMSNRKRYLRVQTTARFGGGSANLLQFTSAAVIEIGRAYNKPVNTATSNT